MNADSPTLWTIHELVERVGRALSGGYQGASSGRIRDVPDLRTTRYYTTLGLLDRPAEMRGGPPFTDRGTCSSSWRSRSCRQAASPWSRFRSGWPVRRTRRSTSWPARSSGREMYPQVPRDEHHDAVVLEVQARRDRDTSQRSGTGRAFAGFRTRPGYRESRDAPAPGHRPGPSCHAPPAMLRTDRSEQLAAIREAAKPLIHLLSERRLIPITLEGRRR